MRALAAEALPEAGLTGVDDGSNLQVAQTGDVSRSWRWPDGRTQDAGVVERSRDWVGTVVPVGTLNGKVWLAVKLVRKPDRPIDVEKPTPAGATDWLGDLPEPDFAGGSLWMLQKAGVGKGELCDHKAAVSAEIRDHVEAQCSATWLGKPGSLTDPDLVFPSAGKVLGFLAFEGGLAFAGGGSKLRGQLGGSAVWSSRQTGFMSTSRIELAAAYPAGLRYAVDWLIGLQLGSKTTGIAAQVGLGASGVTSEAGDMVPFALEFPARLQFHTEVGDRQVLAWFEPSWVPLTASRTKGSPTLTAADQLRMGLWVGSKPDGLGLRGFGAELWETQGTRVLSLVVGILTFVK
ncbi:MAG: hypothetical protein FJ100_02290 [Deltaproteobacteria bacterium]|nr:hypothetical protein [Deltaproteobacteria bacterium]